MKVYLIILLLFPVFSFAQENGNKTAAKPSTTDCPTWKKKDKKASKAEYFQYLRTSKAQPKPQASYTSNTDSKVRPNTVQTRTKKAEPEDEQKTEQKENVNPIPVTTEKTQTASDKPQRVKKSTVEVPEKKEVTTSSSVQNKTAVSTKKLEKEVEKPDGPAIEKEEQKEPIETASKEEPKKNEKLDEEKTKLKNKLTRLTRKTTKVRRHSNAKCPSF